MSSGDRRSDHIANPPDARPTDAGTPDARTRHLERLRRRQQRRNRVQALLLLGGMVASLTLCAFVLFRGSGVLWALALGAISVTLRPRVRPAWVLRLYRARPLPASVAPDVHRVVAELSARADLPRAPSVHYIPSAMLNAFAVGDRRDAAIGLTDGLLRRLSGRELTGVLAHEISHVRSGDLRVMTLADAVGRLTHAFAYAGLFTLLLFGAPMLMGADLMGADPVAVLIVALVLMAMPTVVTLLQLGLSRSREYDADLAAAQLTGDPLGLAGALRTLHTHEGNVWERILVPHRRTPDSMLLRTHPPTDERIRRLRALAPDHDGPRITIPPDDRRPVGGPPADVRLRLPGIWR